jgi:hypothetical protein
MIKDKYDPLINEQRVCRIKGQRIMVILFVPPKEGSKS